MTDTADRGRNARLIEKGREHTLVDLIRRGHEPTLEQRLKTICTLEGIEGYKEGLKMVGAIPAETMRAVSAREEEIRKGRL